MYCYVGILFAPYFQYGCGVLFIRDKVFQNLQLNKLINSTLSFFYTSVWMLAFTNTTTMKHFIFILVITLFATGTTLAETSTPRTPKELTKLAQKSGKGMSIFHYLEFHLIANPSLQQSMNDELSKLSINMPKSIKKKFLGTYSSDISLNSIERQLCDKYFSVIFNTMIPNGYVVGQLTDNNTLSQALFDLSGQQTTPFFQNSGPSVCGNNIYLADIKDMANKQNAIHNNIIYKTGFACCKCQMVLNADTFETIIPNDKYDIIHFVQLSAPDKCVYYVGILGADGNMKYGVCDMNGKEIVPCEYQCVYKDKNNFKGSNTMTMADADALYEKNVQKVTTTKEMIAGIGQVVGEGLIAIGNSIPSTNIDPSATNNNPSANPNNYLSQYKHWERLAEKHYNSVTNLGSTSTTTSNGDVVNKSGTSGGVGHISISNYSQMKKALRDAQNQMKSIRQKAAQAGVNITPSHWETATVSY